MKANKRLHDDIASFDICISNPWGAGVLKDIFCFADM